MNVWDIIEEMDFLIQAKQILKKYGICTQSLDARIKKLLEEL